MLLVLAGASPAGAQSMQGDPDALAIAQTMIERMGGSAIWARATTMNTIEEAHAASRRLPTRSESWRWLDEPTIWGHTQSEETDRYFASTAKAGWRLTDGTLTHLTDVEMQEWRGRWRGNLYVMYHRLAKQDPRLRLAREGGRRVGVHDAQTAERLCWFEVSASGEITKWGAAFGGESEEWVYGPLADFGPIRMPAWGARVDGTYRFRYLSVSLSSGLPLGVLGGPDRIGP